MKPSSNELDRSRQVDMLIANLLSDIEGITGTGYDSLEDVPKEVLINLLISLYAIQPEQVNHIGELT